MPAKDCPLCGAAMRISERDAIDRVPGTPQTNTVHVREWVCPECDYFEDVENGDN